MIKTDSGRNINPRPVTMEKLKKLAENYLL